MRYWQITQGLRSVKKEKERQFIAQYLEARDFSRVVVHSFIREAADYWAYIEMEK